MNLEGPNVSEFLMWSQNQPCVIVGEHSAVGNIVTKSKGANRIGELV